LCGSRRGTGHRTKVGCSALPHCITSQTPTWCKRDVHACSQAGCTHPTRTPTPHPKPSMHTLTYDSASRNFQYTFVLAGDRKKPPGEGTHARCATTKQQRDSSRHTDRQFVRSPDAVQGRCLGEHLHNQAAASPGAKVPLTKEAADLQGERQHRDGHVNGAAPGGHHQRQAGGCGGGRSRQRQRARGVHRSRESRGARAALNKACSSLATPLTHPPRCRGS
jgi:hypothetical protein